MDTTISDFSIRNGIDKLSPIEIFSQQEKISNDTIFLCLNYNGLYGVNNLNTFLQYKNKNIEHKIGDYIFKKDDPILFNEHHLLTDIVHNNEKGIIKSIEEKNNKVIFEIELKNNNCEEELETDNLKLIKKDDDTKILRIVIENLNNNDYFDDQSDDQEKHFSYPPFTLAYVISIHKSQGLEFDNVNIVITNNIERQISHDIFYTAITRAKEKLAIYWTKNVQKKVIDNFSKNDHKLTWNLIKGITKLNNS